MCKFYYDYIKYKYGNNSNLLFTDTDSLMYQIKTEDVYEDFTSDKEMLDFSNYLTKSKYYDDSNKVVIGKKTVEIRSVATEEFVALKPKMYSLLLDYNSKHKKAKDVDRNVVATIIHTEYKDILLNNKCTQLKILE